ncbi:MAG TPA: cyclodeaminase/cyclohydrolase family protein [Thermovirgaceae bacterium]|nr:cyclodeaminase/cyclohydrolase family protein [Thermovirgaceae bacterium]
MNFHEMKLTDFLEELGSSSPAPGGGSVAAVSGALGASLARMVANLTVGREKYAESEEAMTRVRESAIKLAQDFLEQASEDTKAFTSFMKALSMPKNSDTEKSARKEAMQGALKMSTEVPLRILCLSRELSELCLTAAEMGNPNAITDAGVSALMAGSAAKGAALNAQVNLSSIDDPDYRKTSNAIIERELVSVEITVSKVLVRVASSLDPS